MFDELFDLVLPNWSEHVLLNALDCDHESGYILNEHIVSCDQQLLLVLRRLFILIGQQLLARITVLPLLKFG